MPSNKQLMIATFILVSTAAWCTPYMSHICMTIYNGVVFLHAYMYIPVPMGRLILSHLAWTNFGAKPQYGQTLYTVIPG